MTPDDIAEFHARQTAEDRLLCDALRSAIDAALPRATSKIWHAHPVWFLNGNPIVGYSRLKAGIRLMFWSGADFGEAALRPGTGKFKDASIVYASVDQIDLGDLGRWLDKAAHIQWDYGNLRRNGRLVRVSMATPDEASEASDGRQAKLGQPE